MKKKFFFLTQKKKNFFSFFLLKKKWKFFHFFWFKKNRCICFSLSLRFFSPVEIEDLLFSVRENFESKKSSHLLFTFSQIFLARKNWSKVEKSKKLQSGFCKSWKSKIRFWSQSCRKIFTENSSSFPEREIFSISNRIERNNLSICS